MKKEVMFNEEPANGGLLPLTVTEGVTVHVLPNRAHEYLMTTKEVAAGYGVTEYAIRQNKVSLGNELIEGKHFVLAVSIPHGELPSALKCAHNAVLWTRRGIVRLGFTMRGERAKLFRNWAEELIIGMTTIGETATRVSPMPKKRNHNRLTSERLIRLLQLTHRIEDSSLRNEIVGELMGDK
jgi:hypothetical protein